MTSVSASFGRSARVISLVGAAHMMSHVYQLSLPPLFPLLARDLEASYTELGFLLTAFSLASAAGQVPVGFLVDRIGGRKVLIAGLLIQAGAIGMIGLAPAYWSLLVLVTAAGLAHSVYHPADYAILSRAIPVGRLGRAYTLHSFSGNLGTAITPMLMVALTALWDWRAAFAAIGLAGIAYTGLLALRGGELDGADATGKRSGGPRAATLGSRNWRAGFALLLSPPILLCFAFFVIMNTAFAGIRTFAPSAIVGMYDVPLATANGVLTGFLVGGAVGILAGGVVADRLGIRSATAVIGLLGAGTCLVVAGNVSLSIAAVVGVLTLAGVLRGLVQGTRDLMVHAATPHGDHGKVFAFVSTGSHVGMAVMPLVFGWIIDRGRPDLAFLVAGLLALAAVATFITVRGRVRA